MLEAKYYVNKSHSRLFCMMMGSKMMYGLIPIVKCVNNDWILCGFVEGRQSYEQGASPALSLLPHGSQDHRAACKQGSHTDQVRLVKSSAT
jgi:hypothetical protein